jgi:hypothetical protein
MSRRFKFLWVHIVIHSRDKQAAGGKLVWGKGAAKSRRRRLASLGGWGPCLVKKTLPELT